MKIKLSHIAVLLVLVPLSSLATPDEPDGAPAAVGKLERRDGVFEITLVNPEAEFDRYASIYTDDVVVKFRPGVGAEDQSAIGTNLRKRSTKANSKAEDQLTRYREAMTSAIERGVAKDGHFELVDERAADTLVLRTSLVDLVSKIRKTGRSMKAGKLLAEATVVFELVDAETGVVLARMAERREAVSSGSADESSGLTPPWGEIELWAQKAVSDLLVQLHG